MLWIHGGGWTSGSPTQSNGACLATFNDVVVVCISYRLNADGFAFGNHGLWDQLEALKWVQNNIAAYGGDKGNGCIGQLHNTVLMPSKILLKTEILPI